MTSPAEGFLTSPPPPTINHFSPSCQMPADEQNMPASWDVSRMYRYSWTTTNANKTHASAATAYVRARAAQLIPRLVLVTQCLLPNHAVGKSSPARRTRQQSTLDNDAACHKHSPFHGGWQTFV
jgi:hypothetical protein